MFLLDINTHISPSPQWQLVIEGDDSQLFEQALDRAKLEVHNQFQAGKRKIREMESEGVVFEEGLIPEPLRINILDIFLSEFTRAGLNAVKVDDARHWCVRV